MIKVFLILITLIVNIIFANQIVLVVSDDFNSSKAQMSCFEDSKKLFENIEVNIGRNGMAWGVGEKNFTHKEEEPEKYEGDGRSPAGIFKITSAFGYAEETFMLPYTKSDADTICVDDSSSSLYNRILKMPATGVKSFEYMKRDDDQYKIGAVVDYNPDAHKNRGSCIFLHVQKDAGHSTAGCTSMSYDDLHRLLKWLDPAKDPILIQIPKSSLQEAIKIMNKTNPLKSR